ncbi:MAG: peptidoglycan-associated lipoprotein Pal [Planktotalea sp.]|uniref:peptidoglycan-associated lipoprotein Pal n=1 Tax=Planktotalea sp. TaxID=2029877 RepID=UPI003C7947A5
MKMITKAVLLTGVLALAACSNKSDFEGDDVVDLNSGAGLDANAGAGLDAGGANDPTSVAFFQQSVGDRVLFEVDQSTLTGQGRLILDGQTRWLITNSDYTAIIEGHADEQGTREYNVALGERRANTVRDYLVSKGVPSSRLRVVSYGKERPIEICSAEGCYAKNRRAVTVLAAGLSG